MFNRVTLKCLILPFIYFSSHIAATSISPDDNCSQPPYHNPPYPQSWWAPVDFNGVPEWEILPQEAKCGEVILSKRTELGIFSNFASTPFEYRGKKYASLEGFWQATKFPESAQDPRWDSRVEWPYTRAQVEAMTGFEAKRAGDIGSQNMKTLGINWVSFEGRQMVYKETGKSEYYRLIYEVMGEKLKQNSEVEKLLRQTGDLRLLPDHRSDDSALLAWRYYDIWMDYREKLK